MNFNNYLSELIDSKIQEIEGEKVVSPKEFFEKWCPPALSEPQLEAINSVFNADFSEWNKQHVEYLLLWGEGSGKDFFCSRLAVYVVYWLLNQPCPQTVFNFTPGEPMSIINVSINAPKAKNVFFKYFKNALQRTINPLTGKNWFAEQGMDMKEGKDIKSDQVDFPKKLTAYSTHSKKYAGEGENPILVVFDEVAEFDPGKAKELYDNLWFTAESRYGTKEGSRYKIFLLSYFRHENDFMAYRWKQSENDPLVFRSKKATWEVRPDRTKEDFKKAFDRSPEDAARRFANEFSVNLSNKFFKNPEKISEFALNRNSSFQNNPLYTDNLNTEVLRNWFRPSMVEELHQLLCKDNPTAEELKKIELLKFRHSGVKYRAHLDLAKGKVQEGGDCAGFALGHIYPLHPTIEDSELEQFEKYGVYVDLMIQLRSKDGREIDFEEIRKFLYQLQSMGFEFEAVTTDGWSSVDFQQQLLKHNIPTETISVDRDVAPYQTLKETLYTGRLDYYNYPVFLRECKELFIENNKVDHPAISYQRSIEEGTNAGSKDVSDAVAGMVYGAIKNLPEKSFFFGVSV